MREASTAAGTAAASAPESAPAAAAKQGGPSTAAAASAPGAASVLERLLGARVSDVIAAHPRALGLLIEHGFSLLAQPPLRRALAPTVTLAQAIRIRGLGPVSRTGLLEALAAAGVADALMETPCR